MILPHTPFYKLALLSCILVSSFSCSKDADLLAEYVLAEENEFKSIALLADDTFFISNSQSSILLDVLNNDTFGEDTEVTIVSTSEPNNGDVVMNDDNTLTYTPQTSATEEVAVEDTFVYTTEVTTTDGDFLREEATVTITPSDMGELKAFPGAEGFAKYATGGRGGRVLHVTNLNDSGSGSFREAFYTPGPRTIVFDVGGDIFLQSNLTIWKERGGATGDLTIAGETAPFPGITLRDKGIQIHNSNVVIKYISIRLNEVRDTENTLDCIRIRNWGTGSNVIKNFMFDHLSLSHGDDEIFNPNGNTGDLSNFTHKITMQNSMLGEPNNEYNVLVGTNVHELSLINNYFHNSADRSVLFGYGKNRETSEFINNIVYNYSYGTTVAWGSVTDVIGNLYHAGSNKNPNYAIGYGPNQYNNPNAEESDGSFYASDNIVLGGNTLYNANSKIYNKSQRVVTNSLKNTWETSQSNIENLILPAVGNSLHRDENDNIHIDNYYNSSGDWGIEQIINKEPSSRNENYDKDRDGMADAWEIAMYGDLTKKAEGDEVGDGYTNIEVFLFSLVQ